MSFLKSFKNALKGIIYCINYEKNMRIHTVIALYVLTFSKYFNLSIEKYSILLLTIALVISLELINTCVENITDSLIDKYSINVKIIKDICAGIVLIAAIVAIVIGVLIFGNINIIFNILINLLNIKNLTVFLSSLCLSIYYIIYGPIKIKNNLCKLIKLRTKGYGK